MTAWVLIGYLSWGSGQGGPFSAEFASEQACRSAIAAVEATAREKQFSGYGRMLICVPKGGANG